MRQEIIHTPEGVRDIYHTECRKKIILENRLHKVLHHYGYTDIQTPTFEFYDVFRGEVGSTASKEMYKFFDREGNTLALRPDITPSIARAAATLLDVENMPARLCYKGSTFINHSSYQGRLKENTQMGAEQIGMDSVEADAEMIAMAADCLKKAGLTEFQINIGHVGFFESLIEDAKLEEEAEDRLRELIANRNYFGADELLATVDVKPSSREAFSRLPELNGGVEILAEARNTAPNAKALMAVRRLEQIYDILEAYHVEEYVTFDLSMSGNYLYYTGIIFRGYTFGTGDAIVKGGRYDDLLAKFGKKAPSIGFAIVVDELMNALARQKISIPAGHKNTLVIYDEPRQRDAISLVSELRGNEKNAELLKKEPDRDLENYSGYGRSNLCGTLLYLKESGEIVMTELFTGITKTMKSKEQEAK